MSVQAPPVVAGYGAPRTTVFGDAAELPVGAIAWINALSFNDREAVWERTSAGWRIAEFDHRRDATWAVHDVVNRDTVIYDGSLFHRRSVRTGNRWRTITVTSLDEQPAPTVTGNEAPGTMYVNRLEDSSWWRYDDGEWVDASAGGGAAGDEEDAPATDGTITQAGATLTTAGYVRGVLQATQHSYEKTLHVNVELTVPSSDEGGDGSQISVNFASLLDVLDSLNGGGWYLVNIGGVAALVSGTVAGTAFFGFLNDDGTLYGFDGNPVTIALTDDDALNFRASWIISND